MNNEVRFNRKVILSNTLLGATGGVILTIMLFYVHLTDGLLLASKYFYSSLLVFWAVNLFVIGLIFFKKTLYLVDPSLTRFQMYWAVSCSFLYVSIMPILHEIVYLLVFIVVVYGTFRLKPKSYSYFTFYVALLLGLAEWSFVARDIGSKDWGDHVIVWVTFAFCLLSMMSICRAHIQLKNRLKEKNLELRMASKAKSQFLANMSHELRTPLNGVIGMSSLMGEQKLSHEQKHMLSVINTSSSNLLDLINNILDFSKLDAGKIQLEEQPTNLDTMVSDVYSMTKMRTAGKSIDYSYSIDKDIYPHVVADELRLKQILLNLLTNSIKFTDDGYVKLNINLVSKTENQQTILFEISDSGIGISEEQQKSIFRRFSQADNTMTRNFGGTGLGLSISSELAHLMGSQIQLKSALNQGAVFWFSVTFTYYKKNNRLRNIKI